MSYNFELAIEMVGELASGSFDDEWICEGGATVLTEALTEAKRLQDSLAAKEAVNQAYSATVSLMRAELERLQAENATLKAERDAAVYDCSGYCDTCTFVNDCAKHDNNDAAPTVWYYGDCEDWQWRGVKAKEESENARYI